MRLILAIILLLSFSAYGQRVRENIKQQGSRVVETKPEVKKPVKTDKSVRR